MSPRVRAILLAFVALVLLVLAEQMGIPPLTLPGYLVVGAVRQLPQPYPMALAANPPYRGAISVVSDTFWASLFSAWFLIGKNRGRRER